MMVVRTKAELRSACDATRTAGGRVGFVPTMGALHGGHLALIERARTETDTVVVSIFVNPTQFGPHEDLAAYPRPLEDDLARCRDAGVDLVFVPDPGEIYGPQARTRVAVEGVSDPMEGTHRPGHFDGVALVVTKLFNVVGPCRAYFGEKDAQQLQVIRRMVDDLDMPVEVVGCPTVRDPDGLALSSRNVYLSPDERQRALALPRALHAMRDAAADGEDRVDVLTELGRRVLAEGAPDAVDYLEVVDPHDLTAVERVEGTALVCAAIRIGRTRLIDNVTVRVHARLATAEGREGGRS